MRGREAAEQLELIAFLNVISPGPPKPFCKTRSRFRFLLISGSGLLTTPPL
jgi:hypothetical protein